MGWSATDPTGTLGIVTTADGSVPRRYDLELGPGPLFAAVAPLCKISVDATDAERSRCAALTRAAGCNCDERQIPRFFDTTYHHFGDCPIALAARIEAGE